MSAKMAANGKRMATTVFLKQTQVELEKVEYEWSNNILPAFISLFFENKTRLQLFKFEFYQIRLG